MSGVPRRLVAIVTAVAVTALVLTGCLDDPYEKQRTELRRQSEGAPDPRDAAPGGETETLAPRQPEPAPVTIEPEPKPTPEQALRDFGARWTNWTWRDVSRQQRALAAMATGELAGFLAAQERTAPDVVALRTEKPSYRGTVEAVTLEDADGDADVRRGLVVAREQAYNDNRPAEGGLHWTVYLAEARRVAGGWAIAEWEGQP